MTRISSYYFCLLLLTLSACSNTQHLQKDELLYENTNIIIESALSQNKIKNKSDLAAGLKQLATPKPNKRFLNLFAIRLWAYNNTTDATKGLKKWMNESYGEPPVLFEEENIDLSIDRMQKYLFKNGYFSSSIEPAKDVYNKKISVDYRVTLKKQFQFGGINFPKEKKGIYNVIDFYKDESVLKEATPFSTALLDAERDRIVDNAKNTGYYRFYKDLIRFELDTSVTKNKVAVQLKLKPTTNKAALKKSFIKTIQIYSDFNPYLNSTDISENSISCNFEMPDSSSLQYKQLGQQKHYVFKKDIINSNVLKKAILFKPSLAYSAKDYNSTINNLINLGIYKFVDIQLSPCEKDNYDSLNVLILLTTRDKLEFEADLELNSRAGANDPLISWSNLGTAASLSHSNLNVFGGAERFKASIFGGIEFQPFNNNPDTLANDLINAFELSTQGNILIPRFIVPFELSPNLGRLAPKTLIGLGAQYLNRTRFFESVNFNSSFGYQWQIRQTIQQKFNLLNINYFRLLNRTEEFISVLEVNNLLKNSFADQLLFGSQYTFVYNSLLDAKKKEYNYLKTEVEVVGNLINFLLEPSNNNEDSVRRKQLFGVQTAQFVKFDVEGKHYRIFSKKHMLANRINLGLGVPYGNSTVLPYSKQYFIGGANSVRAFRIRSLGPGSFVEKDSIRIDTLEMDPLKIDTVKIQIPFPDQTGEFKIELNAEYRFDIAKYLEAAFFVDAGNIWNLNLNRTQDTLKSKYFEFKDAFKEMAIGAGVGLRLDFSYFVIRADLAIPLRRQWTNKDFEVTNENFKWITSNRFKGLPNREKYVLSLAVGYPF